MKREVEDWLTELPPLDGDDDDAAVDVDTADDIEPATEHDTLDDAASDDLDISDDAAHDDDDDATEAGLGDDAWSADVGEPELDDPSDDGEVEDPLVEPKAGAHTLEDVELDIDDEHGARDDAGEEGTSEPVEHALEGDLPPLDADDEGDFEDALMADALGAHGSLVSLDAFDAPGGREAPRWADALWQESSSGSRPLTWCSDASDPLVEVCTRGVAMVLAVSAAGDVWAAAGERVAVTSFAHLQQVAGAPLSRPLVVALANVGPTAWLIDRAGRVLGSADGGFTWQPRGRLERTPLAAAARETALTVLVGEAQAARLLTSEDGTNWFAQRLSLALQADAESRLWVALGGGAIAVGDAAGIWLARDGQSFARVAGSRGATAGTFVGTSSDAPLMFAVPAYEDGGGTHLVRADDMGALEIVAHLAPRVAATHEDEDEDRPLHLHWDNELATVFVAFRSAIVACSPPAGSRGKPATSVGVPDAPR